MRALTHVAEQPARTAHDARLLDGHVRLTLHMTVRALSPFSRCAPPIFVLKQAAPSLLRAFELSSKPDGAPECSNATEHWVTIWVLPMDALIKFE